VKEWLQEIDSLAVSAPDYDQKMHKLMEHLKHHNDEEENDDLPQLEPVRPHVFTVAGSSTDRTPDSRQGGLHLRSPELQQDQEVRTNPHPSCLAQSAPVRDPRGFPRHAHRQAQGSVRLVAVE
jgi:hypothetical protein